jgi:exodeoxyribonuclease-5
LFDAIQASGVELAPWTHLNGISATATKQGFADCDAECRAVVGWAFTQLQQNPQARLGIVVPELERLRPRLAAFFDAALHPVALSSRFAEMPRDYDFSLGISLAKQPLIATALQLLRIATGRRELSQQDISDMLLQPFWASGFAEADGRAQLDAAMRADLPTRISLERLVRFVQKHAARGLLLQHTSQALDALFDTLRELPARQLPSGWSREFTRLLDLVGWPGDRPVSSHEYQARKKFEETLLALGEFDALLGNVSFAQALQRLQRLTVEQVFQPETEGDPHLFIMGMLETVAKPMDAIWVMGMNDHLWPPPARPNPLLPAALQRTAQLPGADGSVQAAFAQTVHERLLSSGGQLIFSYAHKDGDRELRPSPLVQAIPDAIDVPSFAFSLAEQLAQPAGRELLDDHLAPAITPEERVRGGTGLLKAQAICPAWAYYRYRLGAKRMDEPIDGLDAMARGTLLHAVLQRFWHGHDSAYLHALTDSALQDAIGVAVEAGFQLFEQALEEPLPPKFVLLEKQRLRTLLGVWLSYEQAREPFKVVACEQQTPVEIAGIKINLMIDRIDRLEEGGLVVIDYKTGAAITQRSWADARITEPQLPLYASIALAGEEIAAVCFAQVRADTQKFIGVAARADALPEVKTLAEVAKVFPPETFADWPTLLNVWKTRITQIAEELARGEAGVVFQDEADLRDCDVKPILRLPERKLQLEHLRSGEAT